MYDIPIINIQPLLTGDNPGSVAKAIGDACREYGFFYISGHGIDPGLQNELLQLSEEFFRLPQVEKMKIRMELGGKAWRGYFPVGDELTSGVPDLKEGMYFGQEFDNDHERVQAGVPMHGSNLYPENPGNLKETVMSYMNVITDLGHHLMRALSISLGFEGEYFRNNFTSDPLTLFRIFHYPPQGSEAANNWGVGEHTDYGVLTILKQDDIGGLQVWSGGKWIEAPPVENTFICNIGDMLEKMTGGLFLSTPHRVRNNSGNDRYSFPFFFDPGWDAKIAPVHPRIHLKAEGRSTGRKRWDGADIHSYSGTYGDYLLEKVSKVFPNLSDQ